MEFPLLERLTSDQKMFLGRERGRERERREREGKRGGRKGVKKERERKEGEMLIVLDLKHKAKQATGQKRNVGINALGSVAQSCPFLPPAPSPAGLCPAQVSSSCSPGLLSPSCVNVVLEVNEVFGQQ